MNFNNQNALMQQIFGSAQSKQMPQMAPDQFFAFTSTLDKSALQQLVTQARMKGISDQDIQSGLNILLQHRK